MGYIGQVVNEGKPMPLDPARRSLRLLAVIGTLTAVLFLAACNDDGDDDDDDDGDDDSMGRPAAVLVVAH
jgi:hypothetical protein